MNKCFRPFSILASFLLLATLSLRPAHAQFSFGQLAPSGVNAAFFKLFGPHTNFSAAVDARILDKDGNDWVRVPLALAAAGDNIAMEIDLSKAISRDMPEFALKALKDSGMHQITSIVRADKKATLLVYPGAKSYVTLPLSAEEAQALDAGYKLRAKPAGKDTLAGKERAKHQILVTDTNGVAVLDATTWTAPELQDFPVQIETRQDKMTITLRFTNIKLEKPAPAKFELPPGFTEYKDVQQLMFAVMKKIASGGGEN